MNPEEAKKKLSEELATITNELKGLAVYDESTGDWQPKPAGPADDTDPNSAADESEDSTERQAIVAELETRYRNVTRALEKISVDSYGICELCGKTIEAKRLNVNPAARTCIDDRDREAELAV